MSCCLSGRQLAPSTNLEGKGWEAEKEVFNFAAFIPSTTRKVFAIRCNNP